MGLNDIRYDFIDPEVLDLGPEDQDLEGEEEEDEDEVDDSVFSTAEKRIKVRARIKVGIKGRVGIRIRLN
jgi:hypothetical protein